ncbi:hypothetical protein ACUXPM_005844 [Ralstonia sp. 151470066-2]|jgi:hypothetical protein
MDQAGFFSHLEAEETECGTTNTKATQGGEMKKNGWLHSLRRHF